MRSRERRRGGGGGGFATHGPGEGAKYPGAGPVLEGNGAGAVDGIELPQYWQKAAPGGLLPPQCGQIAAAIVRARTSTLT
jgi:hypothetical protein